MKGSGRGNITVLLINIQLFFSAIFTKGNNFFDYRRLSYSKMRSTFHRKGGRESSDDNSEMSAQLFKVLLALLVV